MKQRTSERLNKSWKALQPWTSLKLLQNNCSAMPTLFDPLLTRISSTKPKQHPRRLSCKSRLAQMLRTLEKATKENTISEGDPSSNSPRKEKNSSFFQAIKSNTCQSASMVPTWSKLGLQKQGQWLAGFELEHGRNSRSLLLSVSLRYRQYTFLSCLSAIYTQADLWPELSQCNLLGQCISTEILETREGKGTVEPKHHRGHCIKWTPMLSSSLSSLAICSHMAAMGRTSFFSTMAPWWI